MTTYWPAIIRSIRLFASLATDLPAECLAESSMLSRCVCVNTESASSIIRIDSLGEMPIGGGRLWYSITDPPITDEERPKFQVALSDGAESSRKSITLFLVLSSLTFRSRIYDLMFSICTTEPVVTLSAFLSLLYILFVVREI